MANIRENVKKGRVVSFRFIVCLGHDKQGKQIRRYSAIHLCMIYLAYPVVADVGKYMGRLFEYSDEITNAVLRQKLYDEWGERGTLQTTTRRVTLTLKELGFLEPVSKVRYKLIKQRITKKNVVEWLFLGATLIICSVWSPPYFLRCSSSLVYGFIIPRWEVVPVVLFVLVQAMSLRSPR